MSKQVEQVAVVSVPVEETKKKAVKKVKASEPKPVEEKVIVVEPVPVVTETKKKVTVKKTVDAKKTTSPSTKSAHPKFIEMISEAIKKLAERSGSSRQAIVKFIVANYQLDEKLVNTHTKLALKSGVKSGAFKQPKGVGAIGSFKIGEQVKVKKVIVKKSEDKTENPTKKVTKIVVSVKKSTKKVVKPKAATGEEKPKKNIKKIVKPKMPKVATGEAKATKTVTKKAVKVVTKSVPVKKVNKPAVKVASKVKAAVKKQ